VREIRIDAPPEAVFPFFTDPARYTRWKGRSAELEPEPGGVYRVDIDGNVVAGEFVEVDPPRRVVFTWGWEDEANPVRPGTTRVEIDLVPDGDGTIVHLTHSGLPVPAVAGHTEGWDYFLPRLIEAAEREAVA